MQLVSGALLWKAWEEKLQLERTPGAALFGIPAVGSWSPCFCGTLLWVDIFPAVLHNEGYEDKEILKVGEGW